MLGTVGCMAFVKAENLSPHYLAQPTALRSARLSSSGAKLFDVGLSSGVKTSCLSTPPLAYSQAFLAVSVSNSQLQYVFV